MKYEDYIKQVSEPVYMAECSECGLEVGKHFTEDEVYEELIEAGFNVVGNDLLCKDCFDEREPENKTAVLELSQTLSN